jgi:hypothetical protein
VSYLTFHSSTFSKVVYGQVSYIEQLNDFRYLENVDFSAGSVDVELGLFRLVGVDALAGQEVDDVMLAVAVAVGGSHLHICKRPFNFYSDSNVIL